MLEATVTIYIYIREYRDYNNEVYRRELQLSQDYSTYVLSIFYDADC